MIIELAEKRNTDSPHYSESLYKAALQRVEKEISKLSLSDTLTDSQVDRPAFVGNTLPVRHTRLLLYYPGLALKHLFAMGLSLVRPSSVRPSLDFPNVPSTLYTAKGETTVLPLTLANDSEKKPDEIQLSGPNDLILKAAGRITLYKFIIPGQQNTKKFKLRAGDYRGEITLVPLSRPSIVLSQATVSYPQYLSLSDYRNRSIYKISLFPHWFRFDYQRSNGPGLSNVTASSDTGPLDSEKDKNSFLFD